MKHLLIEGPIACGKSTAIIESLGEKLCFAAGFATVRTFENINNSGLKKRRGFCHIRAEKLEKAEAEFDKNSVGNFILIDDESRYINKTEVFTDYTLGLLDAGGEKKFILMDEIGGFELLNKSVYDKFIAVLSSKLPCIGVLKAVNNKNITKKNLSLNKNFDAVYENFRKELYKNKSLKILKVDKDSIPEAKEYIKIWLKENNI